MTLPKPAVLVAARLAVIGLASLILLELLWETVLAPQPGGGLWLALKVVPLALLFPGAARGGGGPAPPERRAAGAVRDNGCRCCCPSTLPRR